MEGFLDRIGIENGLQHIFNREAVTQTLYLSLGRELNPPPRR